METQTSTTNAEEAPIPTPLEIESRVEFPVEDETTIKTYEEFKLSSFMNFDDEEGDEEPPAVDEDENMIPVDKSYDDKSWILDPSEARKKYRIEQYQDLLSFTFPLSGQHMLEQIYDQNIPLDFTMNKTLAGHAGFQMRGHTFYASEDQIESLKRDRKDVSKRMRLHGLASAARRFVETYKNQ